MDVMLATIAAEVAARKGTARERCSPFSRAATRRAEEARLHAQGAKSSLVLGCFARLAKESERAGRAFMRAAALAPRRASPCCSSTPLRLAGELALESKPAQQGPALWREALDLAAALPAVEAEAGGITASAEELAAALQAAGLQPGPRRRRQTSEAVP
jgi:hypothetical protein